MSLSLVTRDYAVVGARTVPEQRLLDFAAEAWPSTQQPSRVLSRWWRRADPECAIAAVHKPSGRLAALCAGTPGRLIASGFDIPAAAVCDWYVAPSHLGRGIGKALAQQITGSEHFAYAFSISSAAAASFGKLGWSGPQSSSLMAMPMPRIAAASIAGLSRKSSVSFREYSVRSGESLGLPLRAMLDQIEERRRLSGIAHLRRAAEDWAWRLSVTGERTYLFCVALVDDEPVGYTAVRHLPGGRSRRLGRVSAALIVDLVALSDDEAVVKALALRALTLSGRVGASVALFTTTSSFHRRVLAKLGFVSSSWPIIGAFVRRRSPQYMWLPGSRATAVDLSALALTFADSDMDLNL